MTNFLGIRDPPQLPPVGRAGRATATKGHNHTQLRRARRGAHALSRGTVLLKAGLCRCGAHMLGARLWCLEAVLSRALPSSTRVLPQGVAHVVHTPSAPPPWATAAATGFAKAAKAGTTNPLCVRSPVPSCGAHTTYLHRQRQSEAAVVPAASRVRRCGCPEVCLERSTAKASRTSL